MDYDEMEHNDAKPRLTGKSKQSDERPLKIVFVGNPGVGKTTLIKQYLTKEFQEKHRPTLTADFVEKKFVLDGEDVIFHLWDTAGEERLPSGVGGIGRMQYRGVDCCVLVYDITNPRSFSSLEKWKEEFLFERDPQNPESFPFVLLGLKADKTSERQIEKLEAESWAANNGDIICLEASAKNPEAVGKVMNQIAKIASGKPKEELATVRIRNAPKQKKNESCAC